MPNTIANEENEFYEEGIPEEFQYNPATSRPVPREHRHDATLEEITNPRNTRVGMYIYLDLDIFHFVKQRADNPDVASYQTVINQILRHYMENEITTEAPNKSEFNELLENQAFIDAVAERVKETLAKWNATRPVLLWL